MFDKLDRAQGERSEMAGSGLDARTATILNSMIDVLRAYRNSSVVPAIRGMEELHSEMKPDFNAGPIDSFGERMTAVEGNLKALRVVLDDAIDVVSTEARAVCGA